MEVYDPTTGAWSQTDRMPQPRAKHTATLLANGLVLFTGGLDLESTSPAAGTGEALLATAELYDPSTGRWSSGSWTTAGSMEQPRRNHTAARLSDGTVLVAGGTYNVGFEATDSGSTSGRTEWSASAELYDPSSLTWSTAGSMARSREKHTSTVLADGRVLIAGGSEGPENLSIASAEVYDPSVGTWSTAGSMATARVEHTSTLLSDGRVLVVGGSNGRGSSIASVELYDPSTRTWASAGDMALGRRGHTATLLPDGRVLVAGGSAEGPEPFLSQVEVYDPSADIWSSVTSMTWARSGHTATLLSDGRVLVADGAGSATVFNESIGDFASPSPEVYDPSTDSWSLLGMMADVRRGHTATALADGRVLVTGGGENSYHLETAEVYDPSTGTWSSAGGMPASHGHTSTLLEDGTVLVVGGEDQAIARRHGTSIAVDSAQIYGP